MEMSNRLTENFRKNVRRVLKNYGWTQSDLAAAMGVTPGFVSQILGTHRQPGLGVVESVAEALGVDSITLLQNKKVPVRC